MAGLVPFNTNKQMSARRGRGDLFNMLDDFFSDTRPWRSFERDTFKIDVREDEKNYFVEAELPGVKKEEIALELNENRLSIAVNRDESSEEENRGYVHRERRSCSMCRGVYLADADPEGVEAALADGVLKISVKKQENAVRKKTIEIK